jgi:hypothetical protein
MNHPAKTKWMAPPAALAALRYGLALVSVASSLGLNHAFLHFHLPQPFTAFVLATIAITLWYDGITPRILADVLSSLVRTCLSESAASALSRFLYDFAFQLFVPLTTQHRHA